MLEDPLDSRRGCLRAPVILSLEGVHPKRGAVEVVQDQAFSEGRSSASGKYIIKGQLLDVLFDSGATYSFVSLDCVKSLNLSVTELPCNVVMTTPKGMDWLAAKYVLLDCKEKTLIFGASMLEVPRFLSQGAWENTINAKAFMVMFSIEADSVVELEYISVVRDFLEVFPKDVSELPRERKIEFAVDLILGASPISMAPYRMSSVKLVEVKK
ncbi:uncharacterized protein LOC113870042 [Abrus precatorius]|uniref:Uncharacterized protein LOC113870042 n=1 Tax=Abrus precatorius TaxID=3816 RepID=A0A8B8M1P3_ABRPR|nr:uncharacterized protein LOC113870042 [Abrus precatorius]